MTNTNTSTSLDKKKKNIYIYIGFSMANKHVYSICPLDQPHTTAVEGKHPVENENFHKCQVSRRRHCGKQYSILETLLLSTRGKWTRYYSKCPCMLKTWRSAFKTFRSEVFQISEVSVWGVKCFSTVKWTLQSMLYNSHFPEYHNCLCAWPFRFYGVSLSHLLCIRKKSHMHTFNSYWWRVKLFWIFAAEDISDVPTKYTGQDYSS